MYERETESKRVVCISATWVLVAELPSWDFYAVCAPLKNNTNPQSHPLIYLFIYSCFITMVTAVIAVYDEQPQTSQTACRDPIGRTQFHAVL